MRIAAAGLALLSLLPATALAAGDAAEPKKVDWTFNGPFGTFDHAAARRGLVVYLDVCAMCHALRYVAYRNLTEIGLTEDQAKAVAAGHDVTDGPDETGAMFKRPGGLADRFVPPFPNDNAARFANGGALPPDLSLMYKARAHGADYIYSLLTGFQDPPADVQMAAGMTYNPYFPGHQTAMPAPLLDGLVAYEDGTEATVDQMARDVTQFLAWAAEPNLPTRHRIGLSVMIYLILLAGLLYAVKRRVWAHLH